MIYSKDMVPLISNLIDYNPICHLSHVERPISFQVESPLQFSPFHILAHAKKFSNPLSSCLITMSIKFSDLVAHIWSSLLHIAHCLLLEETGFPELLMLQTPGTRALWCNINFQKWNWAFNKSYWIRFTCPLLPKARTTIEAETTSRSAMKTWNQSHFL